jgi:hypothetical protein
MWGLRFWMLASLPMVAEAGIFCWSLYCGPYNWSSLGTDLRGDIIFEHAPWSQCDTLFVLVGTFEIGCYNFYPLVSHCNPDLSLCRSKDSRCEPQVPGLFKYLISLTGAKVNVIRRHFQGRECQYGNVDALMNRALRQILKQRWWHDPQSRGVVLFCNCPYQ